MGCEVKYFRTQRPYRVECIGYWICAAACIPWNAPEHDQGEMERLRRRDEVTQGKEATQVAMARRYCTRTYNALRVPSASIEGGRDSHRHSQRDQKQTHTDNYGQWLASY